MAFDELPFAFLHDERKLVAPNRLSVPLTFDVKDVVVSPMSPYLSAGFAVNHNRGTRIHGLVDHGGRVGFRGPSTGLIE